MTNRSDRPANDDWIEPTFADLVSIEAEWNSIQAEEELVAAELRWLRSPTPGNAAQCWQALLDVVDRHEAIDGDNAAGTFGLRITQTTARHILGLAVAA